MIRPRTPTLLALAVTLPMACAVEPPSAAGESPTALDDASAGAAVPSEPAVTDDPAEERPAVDRCADVTPSGWSPSVWRGVCRCVELARVWRDPTREAECFAQVRAATR